MNTANSGAAIPVPVTRLVQELTGMPASRVLCTELTLSMLASRRESDAQRVRWGGAPRSATGRATASEPQLAACARVTVEPMDIRTFELTWGGAPTGNVNATK